MIRVSSARAAGYDNVLAFASDLGWMALAVAGDRVAQLTFGHADLAGALASLKASPDDLDDGPRWQPLAERLMAYAAGEPENFGDVPVALANLGPFERRVIEHCRRIPFGQTVSYGQLAALAGSPRAARAVGNVMASNRCPLIIPCHRVVQASGAIGHYSAAAGRRTKLRLLEQEAAPKSPESRRSADLAPAKNLA